MTTEKSLLDCGYHAVRQLTDGRWIGLQDMFYTTGLFVDMDDTGYICRYCYENRHAAFRAFAAWDGQNDPPGPWVKRKGGPGGDQLNPRLKDEEL